MRLVFILLVTLALVGCNPFSAPDSMMDEYVERTARVLDQTATLSPPLQVPRIPRRRDRRLEMPSLEINMLDFLSLYGCELQYVVGEKNAILGKVMQPLNRLRYELRFIGAARDCLPEISDENLAESVAGAAGDKVESLPLAIWNATWGVEEIEPLVTLSKGLLPVDASGVVIASLGSGLGRLNRRIVALQEGDLSQNLDFVGDVHQQWQAEHRAGQIFNSVALVTARLQDAAGLIEERLTGRHLCFGGKANEQARIVRNMFFTVYVAKVQPYLADLQRAKADLIVPLATLARLQRPVMPAAFRFYDERVLQQEKGSIWELLEAATSAHTKAWQDLLEQCGLRPAP
jgi:hypothetical protein